ncbi:MAG TPA: response regulator [Planctomycetota bacterium]|nr:response regulator [Planctomycetota bacterium]
MTTLVSAPALQHVLLIEDEPGDARLVSEALGDHPQLCLHTVVNAVQAIHFMTKQQGYGNAPTPDLIILDLHMPVFSGKALLEERRRRYFCQWVPVVVVTSTAEKRLDCLALGAVDYQIKPMEWFQWQALIQPLVAQHLGIRLNP